MNDFKRWNLILGWLIFSIAATVYLLTLEPTLSYWDCGEFITSAYKLEIGHPPGAPLFLLLAKIFSVFAPNPAKVAVFINALSGFASAFTVMFLFWTITWFSKKLIAPSGDLNHKNRFLILTAGIIGSLVFAFSDSFWFSAVEGEVYATSSFFTAVIFWSILRWEDSFDKAYANKWLVLIAFLTGLSIGVHILNLLVIPAVVLIIYFKKYNITWWGILGAVFISFCLLAFVQIGVITGLLRLAAQSELFCINQLGLPFHFGIILFLGLLFCFLLGGILLSYYKVKALINTVFLCFTMIILGFGSYAVVVIRANANPPMNEGNPDDIFGLIAYLNRDQYGDSPLLYGPYYNAPVIDTVDGSPVYKKEKDKYVISCHKPKYIFDKKFQTIFPRMYSSESAHIKIYKAWADIQGKPVVQKNNPKLPPVFVPTFSENITFFLKYQVVYMYFRYFGWNFIGRQNNIDGDGGILHGNWLSGIPIIDNYFYGSQKLVPSAIKLNKGRNKYYLIPFLIGCFGLVYQYKKNKTNFLVIALLFFMTGLAIVIYLNQTPLQPRERDYAYVGSFYAFSIWIGLGYLGLAQLILKRLAFKYVPYIMSSVVCCAIPLLMICQNWDDHDRSNRRTAHDVAYNYLNSCAPNSILFTSGDNDTFPLWYLQEVEGIRTDVRVVNILLLDLEWYIDQMKRRVYASDPLPFRLKHEQFMQGKLDFIYLNNKAKDSITLEKAIQLVTSSDPEDKLKLDSGEVLDYIPTRNFVFPIDTAAVFRNNVIKPYLRNNVVPEIKFRLNSSYLSKSDIIVLDMLVNNQWKRPVYYIAPNSGPILGFGNYLQLDGFTYRLIPVCTPRVGFFRIGRIETQDLYEKYMHAFHWGGMNKSNVLIDDQNVQTAAILKIRMNFTRLAEQLSLERNQQKAIDIINKCMDLMPVAMYPHDFYSLKLIEVAYHVGARTQANQLVNEFARQCIDEMVYYRSLPRRLSQLIDNECISAAQNLETLSEITNKNKEPELHKFLVSKLNELEPKH